MPPKAQRQTVPPIETLFQFFKSKQRVEIWLHENTRMRIEGVIKGFDEYLNIVLGDPCEVYLKTGERKPLHEILLKADNIVACCPVASS
ncbi:putative Small nuclear ribonucleoprotein E [Monocercomonoides exilis]|uniref:putative Small nuclear ribonucleoprotein E n=1 Tax=Monocercomonoides exilis TaxID=2049356 RepID=UPI00355A2D5F|nr:putative Small nuclear ribonucleoprotein E [Monocercomonoides exilis]